MITDYKGAYDDLCAMCKRTCTALNTGQLRWTEEIQRFYSELTETMDGFAHAAQIFERQVTR